MTFPALFVGRRLRPVGGDGALVDDLHAGAAVLSGPPAAAEREHGVSNFWKCH